MTAAPRRRAMGAWTALAAALLAANGAGAAEPNPEPDGTARMLVDQNNDASVFSPGGGHDLVALDVAEVWVPERNDTRLDLRLVVAGGFTTFDPAGTLRDVFTFRIGDQPVARRVDTTNNQAFTGDFDVVGPRVNETGDGHGDFSITLGMYLGTMHAEVGDRLSDVTVTSYHNAARRDLMPGGACSTLNSQMCQDSAAEQSDPIAENNLPYTVRGAAYWLGLDPAVASAEVVAGEVLTLDVALTNRLASTPQNLTLRVLGAPPGWTATAGPPAAAVCGGCAANTTLALAPTAAAESGGVLLEALSSLGGRAMASVQVAAVPAAGPLDIRGLTVEPGVDAATVRWSTSRAAAGSVAWGPTPYLGERLDVFEARLAHEAVLAGLQPGTLHHLRITATAGSDTTTADATFATLPGPALAVLRPGEGAEVRGVVEIALEVRNHTGPVDVLLDGARLGTVGAPYVLAWDTTAAANGPHTLAARAGSAASAPREVLVANAAERPAQLVDGRVSPATGGEDTDFAFAVRYYDPGGAAPSRVQVVVDGFSHDLAADPGGSGRGATYRASLSLPPGRHTHFFAAATASGPLRLPATGDLAGPVVQAVLPAGAAADDGPGEVLTATDAADDTSAAAPKATPGLATAGLAAAAAGAALGLRRRR